MNRKCAHPPKKRGEEGEWLPGTHPIQDLQLSGKFLSEGLCVGDGILTHLHHILNVLLLPCVQFLVVIQSVLITAGNTLTLAAWDRL